MPVSTCQYLSICFSQNQKFSILPILISQPLFLQSFYLWTRWNQQKYQHLSVFDNNILGTLEIWSYAGTVMLICLFKITSPISSRQPILPSSWKPVYSMSHGVINLIINRYSIHFRYLIFGSRHHTSLCATPKCILITN